MNEWKYTANTHFLSLQFYTVWLPHFLRTRVPHLRLTRREQGDYLEARRIVKPIQEGYSVLYFWGTI